MSDMPTFSPPAGAWTVESGEVVLRTLERKTLGPVRWILRHHGQETFFPCAQKKKPDVVRCWTSVTVHEQRWVNDAWEDHKPLPLHPDMSKKGWRLRVDFATEQFYLHKLIAFYWPGEGQEQGHGSTCSAADGPGVPSFRSWGIAFWRERLGHLWSAPRSAKLPSDTRVQT